MVICMDGTRSFAGTASRTCCDSARSCTLQHFAGAFDDGLRQAGEARDFDAVALVGGAGFDGVQEDDAAGVLAHGDADVVHACEALGEQRELVVMRGEERACADAVVQMLDDGPGEREAVVGGGAAAHLIEQDERALRWRC